MPRLTEDFSTISWAASSQAELSSGVFCSARQTALAMTSSGDSRRSANSRRALSRSSRSIVAETSQVTHSLTCGAVNADATIAWAVALRTPLIGMRVSCPEPCRQAQGASSRLRPHIGFGARCAVTSSRVITPPGPLPVSSRRSTPRSLASLRTGGLASTAGPIPEDTVAWPARPSRPAARVGQRPALGLDRPSAAAAPARRSAATPERRWRRSRRPGRGPPPVRRRRRPPACLRGRRLASVVFGP